MKGRKFFPLVVIGAGLSAYHNSFTAGFVSDDFGSIVDNPTIRRLWPIWQCLSAPHQGGLTVMGRPLINLSLAINYALGGYNVWGYHALNLTVHILAGLTLFGIVRRTLLQPALRSRFGAAANGLALATAVLWTVHPLQTESVTYIVQRAESIMGLFYLLTLYCFIRGVESPLVARSTREEPRARLWYGLCVSACALGMASKEVMVSAPLMVLLYDRAFVSGSFREAWRRRWPLYLGLSVTWIVLGFVLVSAGGFPTASMNARRGDLTWWQYLATLSAIPLQIRGTERIGFPWWQYLATQPGVILHYLRLSAWPSPLCLDIGWPIARTWVSILPPALVMAILLGATVWAWRTNPAPLGAGPVWGFVGAWFFLILAPSSSFIPIGDVIHEHRMYLPLAAVVSLVVMGLYSVAGRRSLAVFVVVGIGLGFLTWRRNQDYQSEITIRMDALSKFPQDPLVHYNLANTLVRLGRVPEAIGEFQHALRLEPDMADAHNNLGVALQHLGRMQEAIGHFEYTLRLRPDDEAAHYNLGLALWQLGGVQAAIEHWEEALRIKPDYAEAHNNLGFVLMQQGQLQEAIAHFRLALRLRPDDARTHYNLGLALWQAGEAQAAIEHWEEALRIKPDYAEAHYNLAFALEQAGNVTEAIGHYEQALRIKPDFTKAQKGQARLRKAQ